MITALCNGVIYTGTEILKNKVLLIEDESIMGIVDASSIPAYAHQIDCKGASIAPGLIDLQIYGGGGYLFSAQPTATALHTIADALVRSGTTRFMLTLATNSLDVFYEAIRVVQAHPHPALMGLHFEGPYINPEKRGAHVVEHIRTPELVEVQAMLDTAAGSLKMMTLAPECVSPDVIDLLLSSNVIISAGHSNATFQQASAGFEQGIQTTTHLFNAMSPLHHRDTGLPGAVFQSDKAYASIIADGIHVDYQTISISKKLMKERLFLITDAVEASQLPPYFHVRKSDRFTLPDGTLSGSKVTLLQSVMNCVAHTGISMEEALKMASLYPARLLGMEQMGLIQANSPANLIVFHESGLKAVWLDGKLIDV